jgi:uncharacterized protein
MLTARKKIWVLQGARAGDNAQARELASLLDADARIIELKFNPLHHLPNVLLGASCVTLTADSRQQLSAPWPDMVIGTGKRTAPVAQWIKKQARGLTKIIHLGRPRARLSAFDLVITTPQYGLPLDANVIERALPFATPRLVNDDELKKWQRAWPDLPKPLIAVAIGNAKHPLKFSQTDIRKLAHELNDLARSVGGSLLLIASPRTDSLAVKEISALLNAQHRSYETFDKANNPYQSALTLADRFVVTSDSISMISELINTGKRVDVFELSQSQFTFHWSARHGLAALLSRHGILQPPRDVPGMVRRLIDEGILGVLGVSSEAKFTQTAPDEAMVRLNDLLRG